MQLYIKWIYFMFWPVLSSSSVMCSICSIYLRMRKTGRCRMKNRLVFTFRDIVVHVKQEYAYTEGQATQRLIKVNTDRKASINGTTNEGHRWALPNTVEPATPRWIKVNNHRKGSINGTTIEQGHMWTLLNTVGPATPRWIKGNNHRKVSINGTTNEKGHMWTLLNTIGPATPRWIKVNIHRKASINRIDFFFQKHWNSFKKLNLLWQWVLTKESFVNIC